VTGIVDTLVPRRTDVGATTGAYLALAAANRVVAPCSTSAADWWASTAGPRFVKLGKTPLDHRRIWDALDRLDETDLHAIEAEIGRRIVARYSLDLSGLVLDMTHFATFIDSANEAAPIAQRGKATQKRVDLRWSAWAWSSPATAGSRWSPTPTPATGPMSPSSPRSSTNSSPATGHAGGPRLHGLVGRAQAAQGRRELADGVETLTLVYDAGQNSSVNHEQVEASGIGFVGSLPPSDHPGLLEIARTRYRKVDPGRFPGLTVLDTTATALGVTRRAILTHSNTLHAAQSRGFDQTLAKAKARLRELADRLARGNTRRPARGGGRHHHESASPAGSARSSPPPSLTGEAPAGLRLSFAVDTAARRAVENRLFGKRILFTNRDTWPVTDVVAAYRSQAAVESGFGQLKDPHVVSFSPMHHWTDQKIRRPRVLPRPRLDHRAPMRR
jgi:hypothetical protein